jgi:hypothetical protein
MLINTKYARKEKKCVKQAIRPCPVTQAHDKQLPLPTDMIYNIVITKINRPTRT